MKTLPERIAALYGGRHGANLWIVSALGLSAGQVSRVMNGRADPPMALVACVELLEALDPDDWPERWRI